MVLPKIPVVFLLLLVLPFYQQAQDFHAGVRAGVAGSQVSGDQLSGFNKAGPIAGIFVERYFSDNWGGKVELVYIQKGSQSAVSQLDNSYYRMRLNYLEVPVSIQWKFKKDLAFFAGLGYARLLKSEESDQLGVIYYTPEFRKYEVSWHAGLLYNFSDNWFVDARYSASVTPIRPYHNSYNYNFFDKGQYNSVIEFTMNYRF